MRATGDVLALDARGHIVSLLIDVAHLDAGEGDAGPVAVPFHAFARGHEHVRAALRGAEDLAEQDVVVVGAVDERPGHRRAAAGVQHVGGQRLVRMGVQVLHDVVDERRGAHGPGGALGVDEVDGVLHGEVLHEHGSAAQKHRRHETVEEAHGVVQRCRHPHDVVGGALETLHEDALGEQDIVVGEHDLLGLARGAGGGEQARHLVGFDGHLLGEGLGSGNDLGHGGQVGLLGGLFVHQRDDLQGGDVAGDVEDLLLVIDAVEGGGPDVGAALHEVHGVGEVGPVEVAGERLDDGAGLEAGHVGDGELGPVRELQGDHVAGLYALGHEPRGQTACRVVHFPVGHAAALVVGDVFLVGVRPRLALPDVADGVVRPIPLFVVLFLLLLVDLEIGDHRPSFLKNLKPFCHGSARPLVRGSPVLERLR